MKNLQRCGQVVFVFLLAWAVSSFFARFGIDPHHDGIMFKPALDVAAGKILFRDTFSQYGALTTWLQASALLLFGKSLLVIKLLTAFFYALSAILLWLIWERLVPGWLATLSCIIWILMAPYYVMTFLAWSSVYALFFQLLTLYLAIRFAEENKPGFLLGSGIATMLTFMCRQPVGIVLFGAMLCGLVGLALSQKQGLKMIYETFKPYLAGFLGMGLIFFLILLFTHARKDWWLQTFYLPIAWAKDMNWQYDPHKKIWNKLLICLFPKLTPIWIILPCICLLAFARNVIQYFKTMQADIAEQRLWLIVLVSLASWLQYYPVFCLRHVYWSATPMIGVFAFLIWDLVNGDRATILGVVGFPLVKKIPAWAVTMVRVGLVIGVLFWAFHAEVAYRQQEGLKRIQQNTATLLAPKVLAGMKVTPAEKEHYQKISSTLETYFAAHPKSTLLTTGYDALYSTLSPHPAYIHPMGVCWGNLNTLLYPDFYSIVNHYIATAKPLIIDGQLPDFYYVLNKVDAVSIMAPAEPKNAFKLIGHTPDLQDRMGQKEAKPDGVLDNAIQLRFSEEMQDVSLVIVQIYDAQQKLVSRWDTAKSSGFWLTGIFRGANLLNKEKTDNLHLTFKPGETIRLMQTTGNPFLAGSKLEVVIFSRAGYFCRQEMLLTP